MVEQNQEDFFEAFSRIVQESELSSSQITKNVIERANECALYFDLPFSRQTLWRTLNGEYRPSEKTLYRILRYGLSVPESTCIYVELLRRQSPPLNHSPWATTQHNIATVAPISEQQEEEKELVPSWVHDLKPQN